MKSKSKKKIISVANIIEEARYGGPQVRIVSISHAISDKVETTVILPRENSSRFCRELEASQIPYKQFFLSRISRKPLMLLRYLFFLPIELINLTLYFRRKNFDLIHVSGGSWQFKGVFAGKLAGAKVIWHLNDTYSPKIIRVLFYFMSNFSDSFIYASIRSKEYYGLLTSNNIPDCIIPAPVDTAKFNPCFNYSIDEFFTNSWKGKIVIGMVANISPVKSIETFIKALHIINKESTNIHFVIIGAHYKSQRKYLAVLKKMTENILENNMEFIDSVSDVRPFLKRFDIYVCSSNFESSPISVWEAMSMEKPIVSTDVGDVSQYIKDKSNGFIVDSGDYYMLAKRLMQLAGDKQLRDNFGKRARLVAIDNLDISVIAKKHVDAYNDVVS
jgi:glycosyltransferase involved in cell wall biosynthesis